MKKALILILGLTFPATALAAGPWGDKAGCDRYRDRPVSTDDLTLFTGDSIQYFESGCDVVGQTNLGGGVIQLKTRCSGEGETWNGTLKVKYSSDRRSVTMINNDGSQYTLRQCR